MGEAGQQEDGSPAEGGAASAPAGAGRPAPADADGPHWIVVRLKESRKARRNRYFRHASAALAITEAKRLAGIIPGAVFCVYGRHCTVRSGSGETLMAEVEPAGA